jgi:hypothetical protein
MLSVLTVPKGNTHAHFFALTQLFSEPGDYSTHTISVRLMAYDGRYVGSAPDVVFSYGYRIDPLGPGGYSLKTEFNVELSTLPYFGWFLIWAYVDGQPVAKIPIMLRR